MLLLHLSDLHFGNKNRFAGDPPAELSKAFYDALESAREQTQADSQISLVVITGDIAESGLPSEFRYAYEFLSSLADRLAMRPERFVILPGNHDISWDDCQIVRAGLKGEKFPPSEFEARLTTAKLFNYCTFLANFYGAPVTDDSLAGLPNTRPLEGGGWLRDFPELNLSVAALNTSERENDQLKGGFLSVRQAQSVMTHWREAELTNRLKIIALHHNPISTTPENVGWTVDWLRAQERKAGAPVAMSTEVFQRYIADLAGFEGREHLPKIVKDTATHLVLHGHHHDQGDPILWPWTRDGSAPVLSVGSFGLNEEQLPGRAPLSCQLVRIDIPPARNAPRLVATPLVYDGRFRLEGQVLAGAFRVEAHSRATYDQPLPLPPDWKIPEPVETPVSPNGKVKRTRVSVPRPPTLYAEPAYVGSHQFVGRQTQLETLSEWASPADSHPVLLFEAIGGAGKSILTWEWTTKQATTVRKDWAGCVWYSFYEKGATMLDFCRRTLGYITRRPPQRFRERNTAELTKQLIHYLRDSPWLLVLDGLERVLVAYHRFDAAQVQDDEAGTTDQIAHRDPCAAINPEDDDLLRALTGAQPSKILLTSRLVPRALLNRSSQPIPGVLHERLPGLRPTDAETLIRACGVTGTSPDIQKYLKGNCDCHPLVIGVLAGLICDYLPNRGNFDAWVRDPEGGRLTLADLNLVQKRNHILSAAVAALPEKSRELLSTLALLSEPVDYTTLCALNPYLPALPEWVEVPADPTLARAWEWKSSDVKARALKKYEDARESRRIYDKVVERRKAVSTTALRQLSDAVRDLERRGLLQYDRVTRRHDLHPVVRGISAGGLKQEEKKQLGQRMVDHFSQQAENPYEQAETLDDFSNARRIVNALFHMGHMDRALEFIVRTNFLGVMTFRLEAHNEALAIVRPFFVAGWSEMPPSLQKKDRGLPRKAAVALRRLRQLDDAFMVSETALRWSLRKRPEAITYIQLLDLARTAGDQHRFALEERLISFASDLASFREDTNSDSRLTLTKYRQLSRLGKWGEADAQWAALEQTTDLQRALAAHHRALNLYFQGQLTEDELRTAEELNRLVGSALGYRDLRALRGSWFIDGAKWQAAREILNEAIALAHKAGKVDRRSEIRLALARYHLSEAVQLREIAEQHSNSTDSSLHLPLALLWLAAGNAEQAELHAIAAYKWAWADGAPYIHWYECALARTLLRQLGAELPKMPCFDPARSPVLSWEADVARAIKVLQDKRNTDIEQDVKHQNGPDTRGRSARIQG
jgi:3',5'-cyclic AMP phosphodiesterase CpdA